jgi:hypothetical protein
MRLIRRHVCSSIQSKIGASIHSSTPMTFRQNIIVRNVDCPYPIPLYTSTATALMIHYTSANPASVSALSTVCGLHNSI